MLRVYVRGYLTLATLQADRAMAAYEQARNQGKPARIEDQDGHILTQFTGPEIPKRRNANGTIVPVF